MSQLSSQGKNKFHFLLLFSSFQVLRNLDEPHPQWAISFTPPPSSNTNLFQEHLHRYIEESSGPLKLTLSCILLDIVLYCHLYFLYYFTDFMYVYTYPSRKRNVYTSRCVCTDISLYTLFCTLIFFPI